MPDPTDRVIEQGPAPSRGVSDHSDARAAALDALERYWANVDGEVNFPVDPVRIAERMGANVVLAKLEDDVSGLLVKEPEEEQATIYLSESEPERRQRFTCAHELGHLAKRGDIKNERIGFVDSRDLESRRGRNPEEIWANRFAAELLMPAVAVRTLWSQGQSIAKISRVFGVSQPALENRLSSLGLS